jgi:hypothetical protein
MTRRYFKDPIIALYMMREFDVKITQKDNFPELTISTVDLNEEEVTEDLSCWNPNFEMQNRLYVRKESEHIFKPQKGDDGKPKNYLESIPLRCCEDNNNRLTWNTVDRIKPARQIYCEIDNQSVAIVFRGYKHFFSGDIENEK